MNCETERCVKRYRGREKFRDLERKVARHLLNREMTMNSNEMGKNTESVCV